jgi:hypothetical protein
MKRRSDDIFRLLAMTVLAAIVATAPAEAVTGSLAGSQIQWPTWQELLRVLTFRDYNTRVVIIGTTLLGLAAGLIGTFLLLRKRALLSDTISHATLPGIALAFIVMSLIWGEGKNLLGLITGAAVFSVLGTVAVIFTQKYSRLKDDAALGIVLSVFFWPRHCFDGFGDKDGNRQCRRIVCFHIRQNRFHALFRRHVDRIDRPDFHHLLPAVFQGVHPDLL